MLLLTGARHARRRLGRAARSKSARASSTPASSSSPPARRVRLRRMDLFFFYAFHELALIPTFLLIGIWGSGERHAAAWKITIYLAARQLHPADRPARISTSRIRRSVAHLRHGIDAPALAPMADSRGRAGPALHLAAHRFRHAHLALPLPLVGAQRLRLRAHARRDAARGRAEKIRPLRSDPRRRAAAAGRRESVGESAAHPARRQHPLHRPRHHRAEATRPRCSAIRA